MRAETQNTVDAIRKSLRLLAQRMDWETAPHRLEEMNAMIEDGDLWSDPARAQKLMRDRQVLSDAVETYKRLSNDLDANAEMVELADAEGDAEEGEAVGHQQRRPHPLHRARRQQPRLCCCKACGKLLCIPDEG